MGKAGWRETLYATRRNESCTDLILVFESCSLWWAWQGERGEWGHPCVRTDGWPSKRPRI